MHYDWIKLSHVINTGFWETAQLPLPQLNANTSHTGKNVGLG